MNRVLREDKKMERSNGLGWVDLYKENNGSCIDPTTLIIRMKTKVVINFLVIIICRTSIINLGW